MKLTRLVVPVLLAFTTPAAAYDCGTLPARLTAFSGTIMSIKERLQATVSILVSTGTNSQKYAALAAARPLLDASVAEAREALDAIEEGKANGCVPPATNAEYLAAKNSMVDIITIGIQVRTALDAELRKVGM